MSQEDDAKRQALEFGAKLADNVSCATQLHEYELPQCGDWMRNAASLVEPLFLKLALREASR